ncbi:sphingosine 1-phosphate receptor 1-like [Clytia hemisphaerica]|uniref:G-protein coupled receptors family 1 profile domain-containing protein n=1 Tax=Clytia hemisphaerica TaxID=252671 RepID=A0A7M6DQW4_9CNID
MEIKDILFDIVSPINALLIIILNFVEIFFIWKMKMVQRKRSTVFILNLSISDLILGLTIIISKILTFSTNSFAVKMNVFLRSSFIQVTLMVSVFTNLVLTTERLLAVKYPHLYRRMTKRQRNYTCLAIWVCSFVFAGTRFAFQVRTSQSNAYYQQFIILSTIILASLPWPIISYTIVRRIITQRFFTGKNQLERKASTFNDGQRFLTLCLRSFFIFVLCWIPYACFGYFIFFKRPQQDINLFAIQYTVHLLAFVNSVLNPILYLYTYNIGQSIKRHFVGQKEAKLRSSVIINPRASTEMNELSSPTSSNSTN